MLTFAIQGEGMNISLPEGQAIEDKTQKSVTIKIRKDHTLLVNDAIVPIEALQKILEEQINLRTNKSVLIESHQTTRYELFAKVLDISRLAGARGFSIIK